MVDIFLPKPVFTHGQLYVAMSRIGCPEGVKLLVTDGWKDVMKMHLLVCTLAMLFTQRYHNMIVQTVRLEWHSHGLPTSNNNSSC
jgi:hypothetical protein